MPQMLQARAARDMDRRKTLGTSILVCVSTATSSLSAGKALAHWRKVKQKKLDVKAKKYVDALVLCAHPPDHTIQSRRVA